MATAAHTDVNKYGVSGHKDDKGWKSLTTTAIVEDVAGTGDQVLANALVASGVPRMNQIHPYYSALSVASLAPKAVGGGVVEITIGYERPEEGGSSSVPGEDTGSIQVGASLQSVQANKDAFGDLVQVTHGGKTQPATFPMLVPRATIRKTRTRDESPLEDAKEYVGKVNTANGFNLGGNPVEARTWLCTAITGHSDDGGETYEVTYEFAYNPDGWDVPWVFFRAPDGKTPSGVIDANGQVIDANAAVQNVQVYAEINFNGLGL